MPARPASNHKPRVLVADDAPEITLLLSRWLRPDYDVVTAWDGEEALRLAETVEPLVAVLDIAMPKSNGLELAEMVTPDRCCGSAGIYNITQTEMSRRLLDDKMDDCLSTGCNVVATANPGCMLQLELGVKLRGGEQRVMHVVELLDEAYRAEGNR